MTWYDVFVSWVCFFGCGDGGGLGMLLANRLLWNSWRLAFGFTRKGK